MPYPDRPGNTIKTTRTKEEAEYSKELRDAKRKEGTHEILEVAYTAQGLVVPGKPLPEGVPANFYLKKQAEFCFLTGAAKDDKYDAPKKLGNLKYEKEYRDYYDDIFKNETEWMTFFDHPRNFVNAEHTCGILGSLATIYRQRGGMYKMCDQVLDMEEKVLNRYKRSLGALKGKGIMELFDGVEETQHLQCYDTVEFKYYVLRFNVRFHTDCLDECIPYFRKMLDYEIRHNLDFEHQQYLCSLNSIHVHPTPENVSNLTKKQILKILRNVIEVEQTESGREGLKKERVRVALMTCAGCSSTENAIGEYKACSRCGDVFYCKKACQKAHWKVHKKGCNK